MKFDPTQIGYEVEFLSLGDKIGDAIIVRFGLLQSDDPEKQYVVVIDGGWTTTGREIVKHIRKYYPTETVGLAISTHSDADHSRGLAVVLNELDVHELWVHPSRRLMQSLSDIMRLETIAARQPHLKVEQPFAGTAYKTPFGSIQVLGPSQKYFENLRTRFRNSTLQKALESFEPDLQEPKGDVGSENNSSVILLFKIGERKLLLTADAGEPALIKATNYAAKLGIDLSTCVFQQVPHHGSESNVGPTILNRIVGPVGSTRKKTVIVSAPIDSDHHPSSKVVDAYIERGAKFCATQGRPICHRHNAPDREGWSKAKQLRHSSSG